jgi:hypothetical protein
MILLSLLFDANAAAGSAGTCEVLFLMLPSMLFPG